MTLYRAHYQTRTGTVRHMTFAHSGGIKDAYAFAQDWECADDTLLYVQTLRPLQNPQYQIATQFDLLTQEAA